MAKGIRLALKKEYASFSAERAHILTMQFDYNSMPYGGPVRDHVWKMSCICLQTWPMLRTSSLNSEEQQIIAILRSLPNS